MCHATGAQKWSVTVSDNCRQAKLLFMPRNGMTLPQNNGESTLGIRVTYTSHGDLGSD